MLDFVHDLCTTIDEATQRLLAISEADSARQPAEDKWSPRQIIGHLIDSASNNHQRFVRAQMQDELVFAGYDQDAWVAAQQYQQAAWPDLVALWHAYNRHLARIMDACPSLARTRPRPRHNLHQLAWQPIPEDRPATLDYFMRDYVGHLKHHLRQIPGIL